MTSQATCPNCGAEFELTEALAKPLLSAAREEYGSQLSELRRQLIQREASFAAAEHRFELEKAALSTSLDERVAVERQRIVDEERSRARELVAAEHEQRRLELEDLRSVLADRDVKLNEALTSQTEALRKARELDDARRGLELEIERRVSAQAASLREQSREAAEAQLSLRVRERDEQIRSLQSQIDALKRRADVGSQQLQGEVQEAVLEETLRAKFPYDQISPVQKGREGADILQQVISPAGQRCGVLIWETKRTSAFSEAWLPKLRQDQREAGADLAVLVTHARPKSFCPPFELRDGVWVCSPEAAVPVAAALRETLLAVSATRVTQEGRDAKAGVLFDYMTGPRFRHRLTGIVEKFLELQTDLARERRTLTRSWAKREASLSASIDGLAGLYGDLQGLAGASLQDIEALETPLLVDDSDQAEAV